AQWYCIQVRADRLLDTGADHCRRDQPVTASVDEATEQSCLLSVGVEGKEGFDPPTSGVVGGTASTPESIEVPGKFDQGAARAFGRGGQCLAHLERGRVLQSCNSGTCLLELGLTFDQGLSELFGLTLFTPFHGLPPRIGVEDGVCSVDAPRRDVARSARTSLTPLGEDRGDPLAGVAVPQWR